MNAELNEVTLKCKYSIMNYYLVLDVTEFYV